MHMCTHTRRFRREIAGCTGQPALRAGEGGGRLALCAVSVVPANTKTGREPARPRVAAGHSPGRVGGRYEEVDDHAVTHVQAALHHPGQRRRRHQRPGSAGPARAWGGRLCPATPSASATRLSSQAPHPGDQLQPPRVPQRALLPSPRHSYRTSWASGGWQVTKEFCG